MTECLVPREETPPSKRSTMSLPTCSDDERQCYAWVGHAPALRLMLRSASQPSTNATAHIPNQTSMAISPAPTPTPCRSIRLAGAAQSRASGKPWSCSEGSTSHGPVDPAALVRRCGLPRSLRHAMELAQRHTQCTHTAGAHAGRQPEYVARQPRSRALQLFACRVVAGHWLCSQRIGRHEPPGRDSQRTSRR